MITLDTIKKIRETVSAPEGRAVEITIASRAFRLVEPKGYWKDPIDCRLDMRVNIDFAPEVIGWAVQFMTGASVELKLDGDMLHVKSVGYTAGPCGDR
jgi:hypothetical protein